MRYFVIAPDGKKYGPADVTTLQQWLAEGRLNHDTWLEEEPSGQRVQAKYVLQAAQQPQQGAQNFGQPGATPYSQPPSTGSPYPRAGAYPAGDDGSKQVTWGWVCAVLSLCCCPIAFGIAAIVLANQAKQKGHPGANTLMIFAIIFLVLGLGIGFAMNIAGNSPWEDLLR